MTPQATASATAFSQPPLSESVPYRVPVACRMQDSERDELYEVLDLKVDPYRDYAAFLAEIKLIAQRRTPGFFRDLCADLRAKSIWCEPVFHLKNCPIDRVVPHLGFEDPLNAKYRLKKTFVGEAFLSLFSELMGTFVVGYRTANNGDMFHDIHPMRELAHTPSQKTVDTIRFHADIPNNKVRPDWVYLLSMRNAPVNEVYTTFVRLQDVFDRLDDGLLNILKQPIFYSPRETVHVHGGQEDGFTPKKSIVTTDRGHTFLAYFEGNTTSDESEGRQAMRALNGILHALGDAVFLEERDLVAVSNNTAMHARAVIRINDVEAHRNRWLLKTWNVDDIELHRASLVPGRLHTSDE